jgi:hypothetical protein
MRVSSPCPFHALHSLSPKRTVTGDAEVSCWPSVISTLPSRLNHYNTAIVNGRWNRYKDLAISTGL